MRSANLTRDVVDQLEQLRRCNDTLYAEPRLLATLPGPEVLSCLGMVKVAVLVRQWLATTSSSVCVGRLGAALRTREKGSNVSDATERPWL